MKVYSCSNCQNLIYFENNVCLKCKFPLGFDSSDLSMVTLLSEGNNQFADIKNEDRKFRYCKNAEYSTCNWLIPPDQESIFCRACDLNRMIPDLTKNENLKLWKNIESAKHRLIYSLLRLHLPVLRKKGEEESGIAFDFLAETSPDKKVLTGHDSGTITLNIDEADEAERVRHKTDLGERYRTLLVIITGKYLSKIRITWMTIVKHLATNRKTMPRHWNYTIKTEPLLTGVKIISVHMLLLIHGKIGQKPGLIIST
jgi:hypothetical protein